MIGVIRGTGSCVPRRRMSNHELSHMVDTNDQWIQERTGVSNRHIIEDETTVSMAVSAGRAALDNANLEAWEIDMIIVATLSSDVIMPNTACMVQKELGVDRAVAFDLNAACSGFIFAYHTAQAYIAMGGIKHVLVIGAESLSNLVDWTDRGTCILFGDGAGAVVISAREGMPYPCIMHADGGKGEALTCHSLHPKEEPSKLHYMQMNGQEVFKFAVRKVPEAVEELLEQMKCSVEEIDYYILHQANRRIVESVAKRLKVSIERFPMNLMEYGNTSSASIPILLDELNKKGQLREGMKMVMVGFGAGLTWGAAYLEWNR